MSDLIWPRPTEADAPVVRWADSVTHFVCGASKYGSPHFIGASGNCLYCKEPRSALAKRYGIL
jgi:hypothetical protein